MRSEAYHKACEEAAEFARQFVLREAEKADLTVQRILKGIVQDMDAEEEKVFYDKDRGRCVLGPKQRALGACAKARDQAMSILGIKAPEKIEASGSVNLDHELTPALQEVFDKIYGRGKVDQKRKPRKL